MKAEWWEGWREGKVDGRARERVEWMGELERVEWMGGMERGEWWEGWKQGTVDGRAGERGVDERAE